MRSVEAIFEFGNAILHDDDDDDLLFVYESTKAKNDVQTYAMSCEFMILMKWWGVNELRLACPSIPKER